MKKIGCVLLVLLFLSPLTLFGQEEEKLPNLPDSSVSIPWSDFKELIKELLVPPEPPTPPPAPPSDYSISGVEYSGRLEEGSAVFKAEFSLEVLAEDKWVEIPILSSDLAVSDVTMDGRDVTLSARGGKYWVITDSPGRHDISLRFFAKVNDGYGKDGIEISIPKVPVSKLSFIVFEPGMDFEISPANYVKISSTGGSTTLNAVLPVTEWLSISWSPKVTEEISGELRVQAQVDTIISVGEGILVGVSTINYEILHASLDTFSFMIPPDIDIIDIQGDGVRDWEVENAGDRKKVVVKTNFEVSGDFSIALLYEKNMGGTTADVEVPEVEVLDVVREKGYLAVTSSTRVEVVEVEKENLGMLDVTELPDELVYASENPILFSYKYIKHPFYLKLGVITHGDLPVLTSDVKKAEFTSLLTKRGDLVTLGVFSVVNNLKQFMKLTLPPDSTIWSAYVSGKPVKPAVDAEGKVLIPLDRSERTDSGLTSFTVEIIYITETDSLRRFMGKRKFSTPAIDLLVDEIFWTLYLPQKYVYKNIGKDMELVGLPHTVYDYDKGAMMFNGDIAPTEEYMDEDELSKEMKKEMPSIPQSQVYMERNIYTEGIESLGGESGRMRGVLPVKLDIPFSGYDMRYNKAIVKSGEVSTVKIKYQGRSAGRFISFICLILWAVFFATLILAIRSSIKEKKFTIDDQKSIIFGITILLIVLTYIFFVTKESSISWGFFWGIIFGGSFFVWDLVLKLKEISEKAAAEQKVPRAKKAKSDENTKKKPE